jgi:NIMA (never in mitosis gene a)-related kinase
MNEIEVMLTMNSPHIVGYYDSFIDSDADGQPRMNIVQEYCAHGDLCNFLIKQDHSKLIPESMVWKLFIHICLGVEHMHFKNYIHRDLKTQNIFLTRDNIARVGDLGLAMKI